MQLAIAVLMIVSLLRLAHMAPDGIGVSLQAQTRLPVCRRGLAAPRAHIGVSRNLNE